MVAPDIIADGEATTKCTVVVSYTYRQCAGLVLAAISIKVLSCRCTICLMTHLILRSQISVTCTAAHKMTKGNYYNTPRDRHDKHCSAPMPHRRGRTTSCFVGVCVQGVCVGGGGGSGGGGSVEPSRHCRAASACGDVHRFRPSSTTRCRRHSSTAAHTHPWLPAPSRPPRPGSQRLRSRTPVRQAVKGVGRQEGRKPAGQPQRTGQQAAMASRLPASVGGWSPLLNRRRPS